MRNRLSLRDRLSDADIARAAELRRRGWLLKQLAREFDVSMGSLSRIFAGRAFDGLGLVPKPPALTRKERHDRYRRTPHGRARARYFNYRRKFLRTTSPRRYESLARRLAELEAELARLGRPVRRPMFLETRKDAS